MRTADRVQAHGSGYSEGRCQGFGRGFPQRHVTTGSCDSLPAWAEGSEAPYHARSHSFSRATLKVPKDSILNIARNASVSGSSAIAVEGKVNVYGTMASPVQNNGEVYTIGNGDVTGEVSGNDVREKEDEPLSIDFIPDMKWTVGENRSISIGIHPIDAEITGITGADWLIFDGHIISRAPIEAGTYVILLTVGLDGETVQDEFVITVTETPVEDEPDEDDSPIDRKLIAVIILIVVIAILVLRMFLS